MGDGALLLPGRGLGGREGGLGAWGRTGEGRQRPEAIRLAGLLTVGGSEPPVSAWRGVCLQGEVCLYKQRSVNTWRGVCTLELGVYGTTADPGRTGRLGDTFTTCPLATDQGAVLPNGLRALLPPTMQPCHNHASPAPTM